MPPSGSSASGVETLIPIPTTSAWADAPRRSRTTSARMPAPLRRSGPSSRSLGHFRAAAPGVARRGPVVLHRHDEREPGQQRRPPPPLDGHLGGPQQHRERQALGRRGLPHAFPATAPGVLVVGDEHGAVGGPVGRGGGEVGVRRAGARRRRRGAPTGPAARRPSAAAPPRPRPPESQGACAHGNRRPRHPSGRHRVRGRASDPDVAGVTPVSSGWTGRCVARVRAHDRRDEAAARARRGRGRTRRPHLGRASWPTGTAVRTTSSTPAPSAPSSASTPTGRKTARERIDLLLDDGSFLEFDAMARHRSTNFGLEANRPYGDGVVTGQGTIDGRPVCVFSQDATVFGGALGEVYGEKIVKVMDVAMKIGCPVIGINDGGGARIQEGVVALGLYGEIFRRNVARLRRHPADLAGHGPGGRRRGVLPRAHRLHDHGRRDVVHVHHRPGRHQDRHRRGRGVRDPRRRPHPQHHLRQRALPRLRRGRRDRLRAGAAGLPAVEQPLRAAAAAGRRGDGLGRGRASPTPTSSSTRWCPTRRTSPTTSARRSAASSTTRSSSRSRSSTRRTSSSGTAASRAARSGVVANQPTQLAGCLDIGASEKAARFVRTCDAFNVPVLTFVDVPGFLPGTDQEYNGIIRRGAKLIYAYAEATVPLITVICRKAYGGAYDVMGSKHLGADLNIAWPTAQIAVTGAVRRGEHPVPQGAQEGRRRGRRRRGPPRRAAAGVRGHPRATPTSPPSAGTSTRWSRRRTPAATSRGRCARSRDKRETLPPKKHGNIPL